MSVMTCGLIMALLIVAGLLVDGGAQLQAHQRASDAAAQVARYAMDAAVPYLVDGRDGRLPALTAAKAAADRHTDMTFTINYDARGALYISANTSVRTMFLQLIGIDTLKATGEAMSVIYQP